MSSFSRRIKQVVEREKTLAESQFQSWLAMTLRDQYGFEVLTEVWCKRSGGARRRIDIYAKSPSSWEHSSLIPAIGIETKLNAKLGTHVEEILDGKLIDYVKAETWSHDGHEIKRPGIILYATPLSVWTGLGLCRWITFFPAIAREYPEVDPETALGIAEESSIRAMDAVFQSVLWDVGAALLKGPPSELSFLSNKFNPGGPRYFLQCNSPSSGGSTLRRVV